MNIPVRRTATLALLLLAALPAFAVEAASTQKPIAVQMYTLRDAGSLEQQLKIVHDAGVHAVETVGTQGVSAPELKQLLDRYSIKAISSHVALAELRKDLDGVVAFNRSIGNTTLVVPYLDKKDRPSDAAGWTAWARNWARLQSRCAARVCAWPTTTTTSNLPISTEGPAWNCCSLLPAPTCRPSWTWPGWHAPDTTRR